MQTSTNQNTAHSKHQVKSPRQKVCIRTKSVGSQHMGRQINESWQEHNILTEIKTCFGENFHRSTWSFFKPTWTSYKPVDSDFQKLAVSTLQVHELKKLLVVQVGLWITSAAEIQTTTALQLVVRCIARHRLRSVITTASGRTLHLVASGHLVQALSANAGILSRHKLSNSGI